VGKVKSTPKVISLVLRRKQQIADESRVSKDAVSRLANEITGLLGEQQFREVESPNKKHAFEFACDQLLAIEFSTNALLAVLGKSLGETMVNSVIVEVGRRAPFYKVVWPDHETTKTYMDHLNEDE